MEHDLSRKWREEADELWEDAQDDLSSGSMALEAYETVADDPRGAAAEKLRKRADALDASREEGRELLKAALFMLGFVNEQFILTNRDGNAWVEAQGDAVKELTDKIRNHLEHK